MKQIGLFLYEWKHFIRSPFKLFAMLLFVLAAVYGLHNGAALFDKQTTEIRQINDEVLETKETYISYFEEGEKSPEGRPWVDLTTPYWAIRTAKLYHFKKPSPGLVYSIGQAEQYGYYKRISLGASPYDADLSSEIANPERLLSGTLDFAFTIVFLLPILLLVLLHNINGMEAEQGFLSLIEVQASTKRPWLMRRVAFYCSMLFVLIVALLLYGGMLTDVFSLSAELFGKVLFYSTIYLFFWSGLYYFILHSGAGIMGNTLKMISLWLFFAFIVPGTVFQWVSVEKPVNLMTDFIDATRDGRSDLFQQSDQVNKEALMALLPELANSSLANDSIKLKSLVRPGVFALANEFMKESVRKIEAENSVKNDFISSSYWCNPIGFFQNRFNLISQSHYSNYLQYREEIQGAIDHQIHTMIFDSWNDVVVDKDRFMKYYDDFSKISDSTK